MAGGALACIGTVQYQQRTKDKKMKGKAMFLHKSVGLLMAGMILPRIAIRLVQKFKPARGNAGRTSWCKAQPFRRILIAVALPVTGVAMDTMEKASLFLFHDNSGRTRRPRMKLLDGVGKYTSMPVLRWNIYFNS